MAHILIAEDDPDIREMIAYRLVQAGHTVRLAEDGQAALAAGEARFDAALVDVAMPGMSGLSVCGQLRSRPGGDDIAVLMISASTAGNDVAAGLHAGADDYLRKPFRLQDMLDRLDAALVRRADPARSADRQ